MEGVAMGGSIGGMYGAGGGLIIGLITGLLTADSFYGQVNSQIQTERQKDKQLEAAIEQELERSEPSRIRLRALRGLLPLHHHRPSRPARRTPRPRHSPPPLPLPVAPGRIRRRLNSPTIRSLQASVRRARRIHQHLP